MEIVLNGDKKIIDTQSTLYDLISDYSLNNKKIVTVINGDIIKESEYKSYLLKNDLKIDLISIVGGG